MDGAFSDNLPTLDENTVTVSPFAGETDICPRDDSAQMFHVSQPPFSFKFSISNSHFHSVQSIKHKHRAEQAKHLSIHANSLSTTPGNSLEYVPKWL